VTHVKGSSFRIWALCLLTALVGGLVPPAAAHRQASRLDNHNRKTGLDLRQATLDHDGTYLYVTLTTYGGFSQGSLRRRGAFWLDFWKGNKRKDGYYYVAVWKHHYSGLVARIFKRPANVRSNRFIRVGSGRIEKEGSNRLRIRVKRSAVRARGRGIKWEALSGWHLRSCEADRHYCYVDGVPTGRDYYWHRF
jgi:hypothetical protein